ncbi:MAG: hypothetical protein AB1765_07970 [Candidatus Hydrogenedentota bacterium]
MISLELQRFSEEIIGMVCETPQIDGAYGARGIGKHPSCICRCG